MLRANPNPPKAALAPLAATKKDKELHAGALKPRRTNRIGPAKTRFQLRERAQQLVRLDDVAFAIVFVRINDPAPERDLHFVTVEIFEEQIRLAPTELTFVPKFMGVS